MRTVCQSNVLSMIGCVVYFFAAQCLMDYICMCPLKILFTTKKDKPRRLFQGDGKYILNNVLHTKYSIFLVFLHQYEDQEDFFLLDQQSIEC